MGSLAPDQPSAPQQIDWTGADWKRSDAEIAQLAHCSASEVRAKRLEVSPGSVQPYFNDVWTDVDWSLADEEIAAALDLSPLAVALARRRLETPSSTPPSGKRTKRGRSKPASGS